MALARMARRGAAGCLVALTLIAAPGSAAAHDLSLSLVPTEGGIDVGLVFADGSRPATGLLSVRSDSAEVVSRREVAPGEVVTIPWTAAAGGVLIEGEEENGSKGLPAFVEANRAALAADLAVDAAKLLLSENMTKTQRNAVLKSDIASLKDRLN